MLFSPQIPLLPDDPIFKLPILFNNDPRAHKVNLGIGIYQDENSQPTTFTSVRKAEKIINDSLLGKSYLPIDGDAEFIEHVSRLLLGDFSTALKEKRVSCMQTVGGAGALRLGAELLKNFVSEEIYLPNSTWVNHYNIFGRAGLKINAYAYCHPQTHMLDFSSILCTLSQATPGSIILLQACGHNPTGVDPTQNQWAEIAKIMQERQLMPFFDLAYHGFADGLEKDTAAIRFFAETGQDMLVAYSFSKNMGLYGDRVGALVVICSNPNIKENISSQLRQIIRSVYSTPPLHGGRIVKTILGSSTLKAEWEAELFAMRQRLQKRRLQLADFLIKNSQHLDFSFLQSQKGMFSLCGLTQKHVNKLIDQYAIFLPSDGRLNIAGLNEKNIAYVAQSMIDVMSA